MIKIQQCLICQHMGKQLMGSKVECMAQDNLIVNYLLVQNCPHFGEDRDKHVNVLLSGISNIAAMHQKGSDVGETIMKIEERLQAMMELI